MEKIIIVFDELLSIRMFLYFNGIEISAKYLLSGEEKKKDEKRVNDINNKIKENRLFLTEYIPNSENNDSILSTRIPESNNSDILIAIRQNIEEKNIFAKIIPSSLEELFIVTEKQNIDYKTKKDLYSKILNSDDNSFSKFAEIIKKALNMKSEIKSDREAWENKIKINIKKGNKKN